MGVASPNIAEEVSREIEVQRSKNIKLKILESYRIKPEDGHVAPKINQASLNIVKKA